MDPSEYATASRGELYEMLVDAMQQRIRAEQALARAAADRHEYSEALATASSTLKELRQQLDDTRQELVDTHAIVESLRDGAAAWRRSYADIRACAYWGTTDGGLEPCGECNTCLREELAAYKSPPSVVPVVSSGARRLTLKGGHNVVDPA